MSEPQRRRSQRQVLRGSRRRALGLALAPGLPSPLARRGVRPSTEVRYEQAAWDFLTWVQSGGQSWSDTRELDALLTEYFTTLFLDGCDAGAGSVALPALRHFLPAALPRGSSLPRAARAIKGWRLLAPAAQRLPLPRMAAFAVSADLCRRGHAMMGLAVMVSFVGYLRPGECQALLTRHLVPPRERAGAQYGAWGLLLHDASLGRPGKTGMLDEAVLIDKDPWLFPVLAAVRQVRPLDGPLWPFAHDAFVAEFRTSCQRLGLQRLGGCLYALRHGGASDDLLANRRTFAEVRERGRWRTDSSVRRYGKATRLQLEIQKVPAKTWDLGQQAARDFSALFLAAAPGAAFR